MIVVYDQNAPSGKPKGKILAGRTIFPWAGRKRRLKRKGAACSKLAANAQLAAHAVDQAARDTQAEAGSAELARVVEVFSLSEILKDRF